MGLPTAKGVAAALLEEHSRATSKKNPVPLLLLTPEQIRGLSPRRLLCGSELASVEAILHRKQFYFFRNHEHYLLAPFGALSKVPSVRLAA